MIPRRLGHIWIGPQPAPLAWMDTWKAAHPGWAYTLYDNAYLTGRRFRNQPLINEYFRRAEYAGVADLMRYEILLETGGFLPEADSTCVNPVDELLTEAEAYTVFEFPGGKPGLMSPFLASNPGNPVIEAVINELSQIAPESLKRSWLSTGNAFLRWFRRKNRHLHADMVIFPSHFFIPTHYRGMSYSGPDKIYAEQMWGTTRRAYPFNRGRSPLTAEDISAIRAEIQARLEANLIQDKSAASERPAG